MNPTAWLYFCADLFFAACLAAALGALLLNKLQLFFLPPWPRACVTDNICCQPIDSRVSFESLVLHASMTLMYTPDIAPLVRCRRVSLPHARLAESIPTHVLGPANPCLALPCLALPFFFFFGKPPGTHTTTTEDSSVCCAVSWCGVSDTVYFVGGDSGKCSCGYSSSPEPVVSAAGDEDVSTAVARATDEG